MLLGTILLSSCKKDTLDNPQTESFSSLKDFFDRNGEEVQRFVIDPTQYNVVTGKKNCKLYINANSLVDANNNPPAGNVTVELREILSYKDMLLSDAPTTSYGQILGSGGEMYIRFSSGTANYMPESDSAVIASIPFTEDPADTMGVFFGTDSDTAAVNWVPDTTNYVTVIPAYYTIPLDPTYWLFNNGFAWINCDYFWENPNPRTNVTIDVSPNGENGEEVEIRGYMIFKNINSVSNCGNLSSNQYLLTGFWIPTGVPATVIVIGVGTFTGKAYFGKVDVTVTTDLITNVSLTQKTSDEIKNIVDGL